MVGPQSRPALASTKLHVAGPLHLRQWRPWLTVAVCALLGPAVVTADTRRLAVPNLQIGTPSAKIIEEMNQQYPRSAPLRHDEAVVCYSAFFSIELPNPGILCSIVKGKLSSVVLAGWEQLVSGDGWKPEVTQVSDGKVVVCFAGKLNTFHMCRVITYLGGVLKPSRNIKISDAGQVKEVRVALAPLGSSLAVVCYRSVVQTVCGKLDASGDVVVAPSVADEVTFDGNSDYLALAPVGSKKAVFCYSELLTSTLMCSVLTADDVQFEGNFTKGVELQVKAGAIKQTTVAQLCPDKAIVCYEVSSTGTYCWLLKATGNALSMEGSELLMINSVGGDTYPPSIKQIYLNVVAFCYTNPSTKKAVCKAIHKVAASGGLLGADVAAGINIAGMTHTNDAGVSVDISDMGFVTLAKMQENKAVLCWQNQDSTNSLYDKPIMCNALSYPESCTSPSGISNARTATCSEGAQIVHGSGCTTQCLAGYNANVTTLSCQGGVLFPPSFSCKGKPCTVQLPSLGGIGDCPAILASGMFCQPKCDPGYNASGRMTCSLGSLVSPTCDPSPCSPVPPPENGTIGNCTSSLQSGQSCLPVCKKGSALSGNTSCSRGALAVAKCFLKPIPPPAIEVEVEIPADQPVAQKAQSGFLVILSLIGSCCLGCCGYVGRHKKNRAVFRAVLSAGIKGKDPFHHLAELDLLPGELEVPWAESDNATATASAFTAESRMILCFSHDCSQTPFVKEGIEYLKDNLLLDNYNFIFQDRPTNSKAEEYKAEEYTATQRAEWRWQWLVGIKVSRAVVCVVDERYMENSRCIDEYIMARKASKRIVVLLANPQALIGELASRIPSSANRIDGTETSTRDIDDIFHDVIHASKLLNGGAGGREVLAMRVKKKCSASLAQLLLSMSGPAPQPSSPAPAGEEGEDAPLLTAATPAEKKGKFPKKKGQEKGKEKEKANEQEKEEGNEKELDKEELSESPKSKPKKKFKKTSMAKEAAKNKDPPLHEHPLIDYITSHTGMCDGCKKDMEVGEHVMDCRPCNWYLCDTCSMVLPYIKGEQGEEQGLEVLKNDEGAPVNLGTGDGCTDKYYCGRQLGAQAIPGSDGGCGPHNGPQCESCQRFSP